MIWTIIRIIGEVIALGACVLVLFVALMLMFMNLVALREDREQRKSRGEGIGE